MQEQGEVVGSEEPVEQEAREVLEGIQERIRLPLGAAIQERVVTGAMEAMEVMEAMEAMVLMGLRCKFTKVGWETLPLYPMPIIPLNLK